MVPITGRARSFLLVLKNKIERRGRQNKNNRPINLPNVITFSTDFKYTTQSYFGPLVKHLQHQLVEMANEFFSKKLISKSEHGDAVSSRQQPQHTASTIMSSIMTTIEGNTEWYYVLIDVLKNSDLKKLGDDIESSRALPEEDQDHYVPMLSNEYKTAIPLPPQSIMHNPAHDSIPSIEGYSAYSESHSDIQDGDDIQTDAKPSKSTSTSASQIPNDQSLLKVNCIAQESGIESTKNDIETRIPFAPSGDHTEYKNRMAEFVMEKETLQAKIKCLDTKHDEGKKAIENLKETLIKKDEEIRRLKSEKEAMEIKTRALNEQAIKEERKVEEVKAEYQATIDTLTRQLAKAEEEKTKALQNLEAMQKELDDVKQKEEVAQIEIERMNTKLAKLELKKEKEVYKYKLIEQKLQSQIEKESETKKAEMATKDKELATKDKELAEAELKIQVMENEKLQKQLEEFKLKNN